MSRKYDPFRAAMKSADRLASKTGDEYFVVRDLGHCEVASQYDMDTYYAGIADSDVLYSTLDGIACCMAT